MTKKFKTVLAAGVCALLLAGFGGGDVQAYELSDEVRNPTKALLGASTIGVRVRENVALQELENKDAVLVLSFGTTFKDTREKTIDVVVEKMRQAFPDKEVRVAFTSHIIIDRIMENEGIQYHTPEEALAQLNKDGYTRVAVVNLNIVPGIEYTYDRLVSQLEQKNFKKMSVGTPIMYYMGQEDKPDQVAEFVEALKLQLPKFMRRNEAVLFMAHGTPHPANAYYSVIQDRIDEMGLKNVYVYSVEGRPHLEDVIPKLKANKIKKVTLMPMMMVAGDHATNDMAGDEEDSHKVILTEEGFKVETYLHGLGENPAIQDLFVERAQEAVVALEEGKAILPYTPKHYKK